MFLCFFVIILTNSLQLLSYIFFESILLYLPFLIYRNKLIFWAVNLTSWTPCFQCTMVFYGNGWYCLSHRSKHNQTSQGNSWADWASCLCYKRSVNNSCNIIEKLGSYYIEDITNITRTQTSLNFGFWGGNFQRKVGGKSTWNSQQI